MKTLLSFTIFFLLLSAHAASFTLTEYDKIPKSKFHLKNIVNKYPKDLLVAHLRSFSSCCHPSRLAGLPSNKKAYNMLEDFLKKRNSGVTKTHEFQFLASSKIMDKLRPIQQKYKLKIDNTTAQNLIWEKKGSEQNDEILILSAYYDNITFDPQKQMIDEGAVSVGADNNSSGIASLMSLVDILDVMPLKKTIRIIFHNYGLWNSYGLRQYFIDYSSELNEFKNIHHIMVQTIGHSSKNASELNQSKLLIESESQAKVAQTFIASADLVKGPLSFLVSQTKEDSFDLSKDLSQIAHYTFTSDQQVNPNPRHFTTDDFVETINMDFYDLNFKILSAIALSWAFELEK